MKTKQQQVIEQLEKKSFVTRNWCLSRYISRLGAIINDLDRVGWKFDEQPSKTGEGRRLGHWTVGRKDYVYKLVSLPRKHAKI